MIISTGRRYIFVHIPKTGGTALSLALEQRAMRDDIIIGDTPKALARRGRLRALRQSGAASGRLWKHSTLADIDGLIAPQQMDQMFALTIVRNPWDRIVSYYHWLRAQAFAHPAVGIARANDFSGFVQHPQTRATLACWPYVAYMRDSGGAERCSLYARFEHLQDDLGAFEQHLGFRIPTLPRVNTSERRHDWRPYYDDVTRTLVGTICAEDVRRFGYRFDPEDV